MSPIHIIGILSTIGVILAMGFFSGRKVSDARSFATGGNSGSWSVCGVIMMALVGGQSTVGTAQLAFVYGLSAWWFTIGAALGCLMLGLFYNKALRHSGSSTVMEVVRLEYGRKAETLGSILCLIGIFISIMSQILASSAMISSLFGFEYLPAAFIAIVLMTCLVVFGGVKSAGASGIVKLILLYVSAIGAALIVFRLTIRMGFIKETYNNIAELGPTAIIDYNPGQDPANAIHNQFFSMLARGPLTDIGGCISLMLGVVCTQTYAAGIWCAKSHRTARRGSLLCTLLVPPIGAACVIVGLYMRSHYITEAELQGLTALGQSIPESFGVIQNSAQAFPKFILNHMPDWLGGIVIGTLLINILSCGSGLALGASTILVRDVYHNLFVRPFNELRIQRATIVALLLIGLAVSATFSGAFINDLGFLSLGLRATAVIIPLSCALFFPTRFKPRHAIASMAIGTAVLLLAKALALPGAPMFWALAAGTITILTGINKK